MRPKLTHTTSGSGVPSAVLPSCRCKTDPEMQLFMEELGEFVAADDGLLLQYAGAQGDIKPADDDFIYIDTEIREGSEWQESEKSEFDDDEAEPENDSPVLGGIIEWSTKSNLLSRLTSLLGS